MMIITGRPCDVMLFPTRMLTYRRLVGDVHTRFILKPDL